MSNTGDSLLPHWRYYADRSSEVNLGPADEFSLGREEQLHETLAFIESGEQFTDAVRERLDRIPHNRAKKHRRLLSFLRGQLRGQEPGYAPGQDDQAAQLLNDVHAALTPEEWLVECRLACGETYAEVADGILSPTALRMRVSRWRAMVRQTVAV
jgi:hypothetical protein